MKTFKCENNLLYCGPQMARVTEQQMIKNLKAIYNCPRKYNCIRKALRIRNPVLASMPITTTDVWYFPIQSWYSFAHFTCFSYNCFLYELYNIYVYTCIEKNMECNIDGIVHVNNENGESDIDVHNQEPIMGSWYNRSNFTLCISEHPNWNYTFESMEYLHCKFLVGIFYCKPWSLWGTLIFSGN